MIEKGKASIFIWVKTVNSFENSRSEIIVMAPTKNLKRKEDVFLKERFMFMQRRAFLTPALSACTTARETLGSALLTCH